MSTPTIGLIAGSTRTGSINKNLVKAMAHMFKDAGAKTNIINLASYEMPIYNGDYEVEFGVPKTTKNLIRRMRNCDGIFIASPEYNGCLPPLLKNAIDWSTRIGVEQFHEPVYAIGSATPGALSGVMVLKQLNFILNRLGATVVPKHLGVGFAGQAFDKSGRFVPGHAHDMATDLSAQTIREIKARKALKACP